MLSKNEVIMPVLGMNQDTGKIIRWLIEEGQAVRQGEPLFEVETDKAVAEIEAQASGILSRVKAQAGDEVPVGQVIATILPAEEDIAGQREASPSTDGQNEEASTRKTPISASPLAARMASEHGLDLSQVRPQGGRVEKADVLAYLQAKEKTTEQAPSLPRRLLASPKARRLAAEGGLDLEGLRGSGPEGAVLAADVLSSTQAAQKPAVRPVPLPLEQGEEGVEIPQGTIWRIMAEHTTEAWRQAPHFFLLREVDATRLIAWREAINKNSEGKVTYTDLLVKLTAAALSKHPRLNVLYQEGKIRMMPEIHIGVAVAIEEGLVVPVLHKADKLSATEIARLRAELVEKAHAGRLRPQDISDGTFTISNLGMYGVDAFLAVVNAPQSAILAVGRIAERVVPANGQPVVRPMMALSLSFDHRSVDGAHGAQFLDTLARLIEEPLGLIS
jgi:pyruvate dehydrogenase E2 component (dihydrolipoamide acetyltransferase)